MKKIYLLHFLLGFFLLSCGGDLDDSNDDGGNDSNEIPDNIIDESYSMNTAIGGKMFSIPSPIQMALLLKDKVGIFNEQMISNPEDVSKYTTTFKKAINMGIYGSDLGYATIFENNAKAVSFMASVKKLSDELGIAGAFDEALIERFIENGNDQDSMLVIMSDGYREGDKFLKDNEQHDIATLILTGGWIESLYFATQTYKQKANHDIADRIGEQKTSLSTIIELLEDYNSDEYYTKLIGQLKDLMKDFEDIKYNYTFIEPDTDKDKGLTIIRSKTSVSIDKKTMDSIISKVEKIRNDLIN